MHAVRVHEGTFYSKNVALGNTHVCICYKSSTINQTCVSLCAGVQLLSISSSCTSLSGPFCPLSQSNYITAWEPCGLFLPLCSLRPLSLTAGHPQRKTLHSGNLCSHLLALRLLTTHHTHMLSNNDYILRPTQRQQELIYVIYLLYVSSKSVFQLKLRYWRYISKFPSLITLAVIK